MTSRRISYFNNLMTFRSKLATVIFMIGLIPSLVVIIISAYLLKSSINNIAASGLETSLVSAEQLIEDSKGVIGAMLEARLAGQPTWRDTADCKEWVRQNRLDLAFEFKPEKNIAVFSDSVHLGTELPPEIQRSKSGSSLITVDTLDFLIYSSDDNGAIKGCGILLPKGYSAKGRTLSRAISVAASLGMWKALSARLLVIITGATIALSIALAIIFSGLISRQLTRPLAELSRAAESIGNGNLDYRVSIGVHDEFGILGVSFNNMAREIKDNQQKLLEIERLAAWREVARRIAHEINNPLTPIFVQLYRLEQEYAKNPNSGNSQESITAIRAQLTSLQELARQFSTFAKEPELRPIKCSLENIIEDVVRAYDLRRSMKITVRIESPIPNLNLDPQMMSRAIANLLKNSHEAAPRGGEVEITIGCLEDKVRVIIRDNGPGFPAEKLARIDQPYITSKPTGTGLGMVVARKIIQEHGGSIEFCNENGAVTEILLPKS